MLVGPLMHGRIDAVQGGPVVKLLGCSVAAEAVRRAEKRKVARAQARRRGCCRRGGDEGALANIAARS